MLEQDAEREQLEFSAQKGRKVSRYVELHQMMLQMLVLPIVGRDAGSHARQ